MLFDSPFRPNPKRKERWRLSSRRFSRWSNEVHEAPGCSAVVQVKLAGELLAYPRGKSAMVWYGVVWAAWKAVPHSVASASTSEVSAATWRAPPKRSMYSCGGRYLPDAEGWAHTG